jgi:hypothetical protein
MQTLMKFPLQTNKQVMEDLLRNLHVLSMPWMKISHLQGKNPWKNLVNRITNPLKSNNNHLVILLKTRKT